MKHKIEQIIVKAVQDAFDKGLLPSREMPDILVEETRHESHGDYATNIALKSASIQKMAPRQMAEHLTSCINIDAKDSLVEKVETAGPGFINFFLSNAAWQPVIDQVLLEDTAFGASDIGKNEKVQVEFVSANPTGPLHVGHGRGAAVGDAVGNILSFAGFDVQKEYYINDSGRQINTLGRSVWLRLKQKTGQAVEFPDDCYQGDYILKIADDVRAQFGEQALFDKPKEEAVAVCARYAAGKILDEIKQDLSDFGVEFDQWFSEQSLYDSRQVEKTIERFQSKGMIYEKDGAKWFRTQDFGDEKDRVVVRNNGRTTYFASDIAYHREKFDRGFHRVIDVWGADHHGYINRIEASIKAWAQVSDQKEAAAKEQFDVILVQLVNLLRGGVPLQMSTRAGQFVTLKDIVNEVGKDAARFMFLSRSYDSGLDFDLELARRKNADNPVYYVQYVHARITGILMKAKEQKIISDTQFQKGRHLHLLTALEEIKLIKILNAFQDNVEKSALTLHPHVIFTFLMNLAGAFHGYYNKHKVICDEAKLTHARLSLVLAVKKVIANGLALLGVSAPDRM